jgi:homoserine/homoserine lactone efflux protein
MDSNIWWSYFVAAWLIALSPGSGAVLSVGHGLRYGVKGASATILGLQAGLAGITLIAGVGVGSLLVASAPAFTAVKLAGAACLLWLGWQQWRAPVHEGHGVLDDAADAGRAAARRGGCRRASAFWPACSPTSPTPRALSSWSRCCRSSS